MSAPTNLEAIQAVLSSERFLDEPVSEYKPKSIGKMFDLGTASTLREYYKQNLLNVPGRLAVGTAEITTTPEVMAILRALLYTGCCRIVVSLAGRYSPAPARQAPISDRRS